MDEPLLLRHQGIEQMLLLNLHVLVFYSSILCKSDGLQGFLRKFLCIHSVSSSLCRFKNLHI